MEEENRTKTKLFLKKGAILWAIVTAIFILLLLLSKFTEKGNGSEILGDLSTVLFLYGICGIPIVLFFTLILSLVKSVIDEIPPKDD